MAADSNVYLETGAYYLKEELEANNPPGEETEYLNRLREIGSPSTRTWALVRSIFNPFEPSTYEGRQVYRMAFCGLASGFIYSLVFKTTEIREKFKRTHNAHVFDHRYLADRAFRDILIQRTAMTTLNYAVPTGLLMGSTGLVIFCSMTYRDKLYVPDWTLGFAAIGGISRFMLGPRAMLVGAGIAAPIGVACCYVAKGILALTGLSLAQIRYENHQEWAKNLETRRFRNALGSEREFVEKMRVQ